MPVAADSKSPSDGEALRAGNSKCVCMNCWSGALAVAGNPILGWVLRAWFIELVEVLVPPFNGLGNDFGGPGFVAAGQITELAQLLLLLHAAAQTGQLIFFAVLPVGAPDLPEAHRVEGQHQARVNVGWVVGTVTSAGGLRNGGLFLVGRLRAFSWWFDLYFFLRRRSGGSRVL